MNALFKNIHFNPKGFFWLFLASLLVALDQLSKHLIKTHLLQGEALPLTPFFNLRFIYNKGAGFSFLSEEKFGIFLLSSISLLFSLLAILRFLFFKSTIKLNITWMLLLGGAFGNGIDRIYEGKVLDFLDLYIPNTTFHFPTFNLADSLLSLGAVLLLYWAFMDKKEPQ